MSPLAGYLFQRQLLVDGRGWQLRDGWLQFGAGDWCLTGQIAARRPAAPLAHVHLNTNGYGKSLGYLCCLFGLAIWVRLSIWVGYLGWEAVDMTVTGSARTSRNKQPRKEKKRKEPRITKKHEKNKRSKKEEQKGNYQKRTERKGKTENKERKGKENK